MAEETLDQKKERYSNYAIGLWQDILSNTKEETLDLKNGFKAGHEYEKKGMARNSMAIESWFIKKDDKEVISYTKVYNVQYDNKPATIDLNSLSLQDLKGMIIELTEKYKKVVPMDEFANKFDELIKKNGNTFEISVNDRNDEKSKDKKCKVSVEETGDDKTITISGHFNVMGLKEMDTQIKYTLTSDLAFRPKLIPHPANLVDLNPQDIKEIVKEPLAKQKR
jgi:hypothetical protein